MAKDRRHATSWSAAHSSQNSARPSGAAPYARHILDRKIADDQHGHIDYDCDTRTVNISDLKAQLSAHIQLVRDGVRISWSLTCTSVS